MLLKPCFNLKNIYEIDLELLKSQGVKAMFFDLDSTIMVSKSGSYDEKTIQWLEGIKKDFFVAVLTNNKNPDYIEKVKQASDFEIVPNAKKPSIIAMKELMIKNNFKPKEVVMIGDRPLTDILAGKRLKTRTILVGSINAHNEGIPTRFVRWLERRFILN